MLRGRGGSWEQLGERPQLCDRGHSRGWQCSGPGGMQRANCYLPCDSLADTQAWHQSPHKAPRSMGWPRQGPLGCPVTPPPHTHISGAARVAPSSACDWPLPATRTWPGRPREAQQNGQRHELLANEVWSHGEAARAQASPRWSQLLTPAPGTGRKLGCRELLLMGEQRQFGGGSVSAGLPAPTPPHPSPGPGQGPSWNARRLPEGQRGARELGRGASGEEQAPSCRTPCCSGPTAKQPEGAMNPVQAG